MRASPMLHDCTFPGGWGGLARGSTEQPHAASRHPETMRMQFSAFLGVAPWREAMLLSWWGEAAPKDAALGALCASAVSEFPSRLRGPTPEGLLPGPPFSPTFVAKRRRRLRLQGLRPRPPEAYPGRYVEVADRA
jgi:hypothetical protein